MALDEGIRKRIDGLLGEVGALAKLANVYEQIVDPVDLSRCAGWLAAAQNISHQICVGSSTPYLKRIDGVVNEPGGFKIHEQVLELAAVLRELSADADAGLISSVADRASAETFGNFLDHGEEYCKLSRKNESGVIVGVVFEDTVRRICRKYGITEKDKELDSLISALATREILTGVKAKRGRSAAAVRTKATHAQWDEFELSDVEAAITFTRELISYHLDI
jgi:hypothetical protein